MGENKVDKGVNVTGDLVGNTEMVVTNTSVTCLSMGEIVEKNGMPFIWVTGQKPYHVTDPRKLSIRCPLKYRRYADRVEDNNPIFKETLTFRRPGADDNTTDFRNAFPFTQEGGSSSSGAAPPPVAIVPPLPPPAEPPAPDPGSSDSRSGGGQT